MEIKPTGHVAVATARVAGLAGTAEAALAAIATLTTEATRSTSTGAVAGNVTHLTALFRSVKKMLESQRDSELTL